ncbi:uncharacterized protein [Maniola hyperantus]|uniref:uncharacterized protein n=1 Tax=Aphantopus hyperantus TaxID=2795564 RepID=UPI0015682420|nr:uncharacterized protein LOC117984016 [Maniola hyperantus]
MKVKFIGFFVFLSLCIVKSLLMKPREFCVPTQVVKGPCHKCICNADGVFVCDATPCPKTVVNPRKSSKDECQRHVTYRFEELYCTCNYEGKWMSLNCREAFQYLRSEKTAVKRNSRSNNTITSTNYQIDHDELPEIEDGQSCIQGKVYKMSCNTCQCGPKNSLLCTKMACFENAVFKEIIQAKKDEHNNEKKKIEVVRKDILRKGLHGSEQKKLPNKSYPQLPKGKCEPGMTYRNGCKKCFCNEKKVAKCTRTCSSGFPSLFNDKEISEMVTRSVLELPELPHMGAKCDPGRTYYVVCNICFCSHKQDLYCSAKYCVSVPTYADVLSKELTGRPCKKDFRLLCSDCKCVNLKNQCKSIPNCGKNLTGKQLLSSAVGVKVKLSLDITKEKCIPNVAYKLHCNDCYCQSDGSLRCTQKICLTYSQTKDLQEKQTYLE